MARVKEQLILFPPEPPMAIKRPTSDEMYHPCEFDCMSGDPQCGCWNDYLMMIHYNQEKFQDHKEGNFPPA